LSSSNLFANFALAGRICDRTPSPLRAYSIRKKTPTYTIANAQTSPTFDKWGLIAHNHMLPQPLLYNINNKSTYCHNSSKNGIF
ncbi:MAG: hypothetical protein ACI308_00240, partial [Muribaculaceae bacterium]